MECFFALSLNLDIFILPPAGVSCNRLGQHSCLRCKVYPVLGFFIFSLIGNPQSLLPLLGLYVTVLIYEEPLELLVDVFGDWCAVEEATSCFCRQTSWVVSGWPLTQACFLSLSLTNSSIFVPRF